MSVTSNLTEAMRYHRAGQLAQAESLYRATLLVRPDSIEAQAMLGTCLAQAGRTREAIEFLGAAARARPDPAILSNLANALWACNQPGDALACLSQAIALAPRGADLRVNRANLLVSLGRFEEALQDANAALQLSSSHARAYAVAAAALQGLDRQGEAVSAFSQALVLRPGDPQLLLALSQAELLAGRPDAALAHVDAALASLGTDWGALLTRAGALRALHRHREALHCYDLALSQPHATADSGVTHVNRAYLQLLLGDFEAGWRELEWRWSDATMVRPHPHGLDKLWLGDRDLLGKTLLVHVEQGFGDTIQFCRYVPLLAQRGAQVLLEAPGPLRAVLATLGGCHLVDPADPLPPFDLHVPILSLPLAFGTTLPSIPSRTPYLFADPPLVADAALCIARAQGVLQVGLVWAGNPVHRNDRNRSIPLSVLLEVCQRQFDDRIAWHSLQRGAGTVEREQLRARGVRHHGESIDDFSRTAALLMNLDIVITVDTSTAHLAGALGKEAWILLPSEPDWRWMLDRSDSPWYPHARLYRQAQAGDWTTVTAEVARQLQARLH